MPEWYPAGANGTTWLKVSAYFSPRMTIISACATTVGLSARVGSDCESQTSMRMSGPRTNVDSRLDATVLKVSLASSKSRELTAKASSVCNAEEVLSAVLQHMSSKTSLTILKSRSTTVSHFAIANLVAGLPAH